MPDRYTFNVDNNSSDEAVERAIVDLKKMVEFGKRAEVALAELKSHGFYDEPTPTIQQQGRNDRVYYSVAIHTFTKRETVSRLDLAPFDSIQIEFGDGFDKSTYGGHESKSVRIFATGIAKVQQADGRYTEEPFRSRIGKVRVNQNYFSFIPCKSNGAFKVYTSLKVSPKAQASYEAIATAISTQLVDVVKDVIYNQVSMDLRERAPKWLIEDGVIECISNQILTQIRVFEVISS